MPAGRLATEVISLFKAICPATQHLRPGQLLWTVPDRNTNPRRTTVPSFR